MEVKRQWKNHKDWVDDAKTLVQRLWKGEYNELTVQEVAAEPFLSGQTATEPYSEMSKFFDDIRAGIAKDFPEE